MPLTTDLIAETDDRVVNELAILETRALNAEAERDRLREALDERSADLRRERDHSAGLERSLADLHGRAKEMAKVADLGLTRSLVSGAG